MPHIKSWEPRSPTVVPDGIQAYSPDILRLQKEPRCACLSEAKASHLHNMWVEVSSFVPHFPHKGLSCSPSRWRCLLRVLWPVSRPVTALDWSLLKVMNFAREPRLGPEISSRACRWVSPRPCHWALCWLSSQRRSLWHSYLLYNSHNVEETSLRGW